jgi:polysaccharide export outer membrane protein
LLSTFILRQSPPTCLFAKTAFVLLSVALAAGAVHGAPASGSAANSHSASKSEQATGVSPRAGTLDEPRPVDAAEYRIGPNDLLAISVVQAPELNAAVRVSDAGEISLPLLGPLRATGLRVDQLEAQIERLLGAKYIRTPDVTVQVAELHSQPVSVLGAVSKPGVFQIRGRYTLLEILSLAGGLTEDAGNTALIVRKGAHFGAAANTATFQVPLGDPTDSQNAPVDVAIYPGDVVKVQTAGIVYVVGAVNKPGSFALRGNHALTVLRAIAVAEGFTPTAAKRDAVILRTNEAGERLDLTVDLNAILARKKDDVALQPADVLFVPVSGGKVVARAAIDVLARIVTFRGVIP